MLHALCEVHLPKITAQEIKDLGFNQAMFSVMAADETAFTALITAVITEKSDELQGRIGSTAYNDSAKLTYVKKAEKCLSAAEMVQRRINIILGNTVSSGSEINTKNEQDQRKDYLTQAEEWIAKVAQGVTVDTGSFATGVSISSHFDS